MIKTLKKRYKFNYIVGSEISYQTAILEMGPIYVTIQNHQKHLGGYQVCNGIVYYWFQRYFRFLGRYQFLRNAFEEYFKKMKPGIKNIIFYVNDGSYNM